MSEGRRFCENCGTEIGQTTNFCPNCGAAQKPDPEVPSGPLSPGFEADTITTPKVSGVPPLEPRKESPKKGLLPAVILAVVIYTPTIRHRASPAATW